MSGHSNTKGNQGFLKTQYDKNKNYGEKAMGFEYKMTVKGYDDFTVLCRSTQLPPMGRSDVEDYGPAGLLFVQHGALENSGEITIGCVETITGHMLKALRDIVINKKYVDINIQLTPESTGGKFGTGQSYDLLDCKLRCDAVDLSTEDTSALVKPNLTCRFNFIDNLGV